MLTKRTMLTHLNKRPLAIAVAVCGLLTVAATPSTADAGDWMFRRSYYSHELPAGAKVDYPLPNSRSAYRRPWVAPSLGYSTRGAYRFNRMQLRSGNSVDTTIFYEGRFELRP